MWSQGGDVVVAEVKLHDAGEGVEVVADGADDVEAEVEALEAAEVGEGVVLDEVDAVVVQRDHLKLAQAAERAPPQPPHRVLQRVRPLQSSMDLIPYF